VKAGFPGAGEAGAAGGMPVSVGDGVGEPAAAAAGSPAAPGHVGMGTPDGNGTGRDAHAGRHVGMGSDGSGTGSDGRQVGTPPLGKQVGIGNGIGVGSGGRHVGMPLGAPMDGSAPLGPLGPAAADDEDPGRGRLGRLRLGRGPVGPAAELEAASVRLTGRARTTATVRNPASRTDRFFISSVPPTPR